MSSSNCYILYIGNFFIGPITKYFLKSPPPSGGPFIREKIICIAVKSFKRFTKISLKIETYAFANENISSQLMDDLNQCIDHIITYHQWPLNTNQMLVFTLSSIKGQFRQICEAFKHEVKNWHLALIVCAVYV